ncbi:hypothetical protein A3A39_03495 [Candidatus Kaiserbacteria bacterium RIFCSPLOWO2_01_FULL_54_13]|uniref:Uncharacterized protein n=1 Tax=Candidatus Kaiserbacteria bacterium RIFCSPLOWO2_01_FULL_54_13 TaxID=1798512 RepID=A0A1F6F389_9BACT|nr:MAG: hypothetical protein A3A39_03495 [Candidatus Kaiserbacteria bacterium RIFCSPLOWO2_01_FULL_54_13]
MSFLIKKVFRIGAYSFLSVVAFVVGFVVSGGKSSRLSPDDSLMAFTAHADLAGGTAGGGGGTGAGTGGSAGTGSGSTSADG